MRAQFYMLVVALIAAGSVQPATAQGGDAENGKDLFKVCRPCDGDRASYFLDCCLR
jgi:cytochrome c2